MPLPKLTPLQSRFAASLGATIILFLLYYCLSQPAFAYAAEIDLRIPPDHNHPILDQSFTDDEPNLDELLVKRQNDGNAMQIFNNQPRAMNIASGETQNWLITQDTLNGPPGDRGPGLPSPTGANASRIFEDEDIEEDENTTVDKRQAERTVYITITTCIQPTYNGSSPELEEAIPPQLTLYVSQSENNRLPGPDSNGSDSQQVLRLSGGYAKIELDNTSPVYIGVSAPNGTQFIGSWNYEIGGSIDEPYHTVITRTPNLHFVDGDTHAALLITDDLTSAEPNETSFSDWMELRPPFGMFVYPSNSRAMQGVRNSYCGLRMAGGLLANLQNASNQNVAEMTSRGLGGKPKEQFYITGLNSSSQYTGFLAMQGNSTDDGNNVVGGGGTVWQAVQFSTKSMSNCALMYNLTFCSEVAYAVPANPERFSIIDGLPELARIYDDYAREMYRYFNFSLQQIPCNTSSTSQYSLVRNCDDCARAYKTWLCAVTTPRCEDYNNTAVYLKPRNLGQPYPNGTSISSLPGFSDSQQVLMDTVATNSSRSQVIDDQIAPGPYKEVLPCKDLCYDLVQSCPAALGFSCPSEGKGLENSYGERNDDPGNISCSYLGAAYYLSAGDRNTLPYIASSAALALMLSLLFL